jgi:thioredoxin 1
MRKIVFYAALYAGFIFLTGCSKNPAAPPAIPEGVAMLDKTNFSAMTSVSGRVAMIEFYSPDIIACQKMDSSVTRIAERYKGKALVGKVNFTEDDQLQFQFDIRYVPTFLFLNGGQEARRLEKPNGDDSLAIIIDSLFVAQASQ